MALDLKKHKEAIVAAWKDVSNPDSTNTWAIFGYEGQTGVLKVIEVGDGEFDEMVENLNSGMIQYAYCRVKDPNTKLPKYVLINWQGDGAPDTWKGRCAGHFKDISLLLRGAHLTINARDEADLDKDDVLKQVAKSSGAQYSIHKEEPRREDSPSGPVGSVYKKVVPQAEIRVSERDQFWERNELEEKKRREAETKEKAEIQKKMDQERVAREKQEAHERERKIQEHARQVEMQKQAERAANQAAAAANQKTSSHVDDDDSERRNKSEMLRQQRAAEAASLVKQRENNPKEMFKQRERAYSQEEPAPVKAPPRPLPKAIPREEQRSVPVAVEPPPLVRSQVPVDVPVQQRQMPREPSPPPREPSPPPREPSPEPVRPEPVITRMMSQGLPKRQESDEEEEEQDWDAPTHEDFSHVIDPYQQKNEPEVHGEGGIKARAVYDYAATADDEVSFDPNDLITEIEKVDEGWWIGTAPSGCRGLFPANYVELI